MLIYHETKIGSLREASRLRKELSRRLADLRLPDSVVCPLLLGVSEILGNILKHSEPLPSFIGVRVDLLGSQLRLEITDDGGSFFDFVERVSNAGSTGHPELLETGRGLGLIGESLERLSYETGNVNRSVGWKSIVSKKPMVLIVEDDETLLDIYAHFLRDLLVVKARCCDEAVAIIRELDVSVIVADLHLRDGLATNLLQAVEVELDASVPIILISGTEDVAGPQDALERGVEIYLAKPVSGHQLRAAIEIVIARSARRSAHLARFFARKLDGLLISDLTPFACGHDIIMSRSSAGVGGGDLVFEHRLPGRRRIVLLDVMGHGVSAKAWSIAYAALCRGLCHAQPADDCAFFLGRLAEIAWSDRAMDCVIATALALDLHDDGLIEIASAGHPAPVILEHSNIRQVPVSGALLGVMAPELYQRTSIHLEANQRLVLVTDGVDSGDVAAGGALPDWLTKACAHPDIFASRGRELEKLGITHLGVQPKDDWTIIVISPTIINDQA